MRKYTTFGAAVKKQLLIEGKTQKWLNEKVSEDTGLYVDDGRMWRILTGQSRSDKISNSICKVLNLQLTQDQ